MNWEGEEYYQICYKQQYAHRMFRKLPLYVLQLIYQNLEIVLSHYFFGFLLLENMSIMH
jgi:hypothetical protein